MGEKVTSPWGAGFLENTGEKEPTETQAGPHLPFHCQPSSSRSP